ncbi:hypothetical protein [Oscillibacter sp. MSJ-31]|uniref:hypothetical protein n=1 Tax=Oscillibacter sp. MSJ-31 TaxID=2841526 RepID=UPI001C0F75C4|nr:hypothetical protein [Oscillibacter sp. MSJ-31]MBU5458066.1 hypothetical protein [Oscillibacter sp. MSJ-31]
MKLKIGAKKLDAGQVLLAIIYKIVLDASYGLFEVRYFGYLGIECKIMLYRIMLGWLIYLGTFAVIHSNECKIVNLFSYIMLFLSMAPFVTLYQFWPECKLWMVFLQISALLFIDIIARRFTLKAFSIKSLPYQDFRVVFAGWLFLIAMFLYMFMKFRLPSFSLLGFESIYLVRADSGFSTFDSILTCIACKIICPLYMVVCWKKKKYLKLAFLALIQLYIYSISGFKTFLFIPIVLFGLEFFKNIDLRKLIIAGLTGTLLFVDLIQVATGRLMPYALIGDRTIFFPAIIKRAFFDFFSKNPYVYFSQNSIARIFGIKSVYETNVFNIIGAEYFDKPNMWTNTGVFADAYSNLGVAGVFIISFLLAIILIIVSQKMESFSGDVKNAMTAIYILYFISFNDGAFLFTMVSGGFLIVMIIAELVDFSSDIEVENKDLRE